jgi:hypothetical protein
MKLVFVYWGFENAGSMLDLKGYARAAVAAGHQVTIYGPPGHVYALDYSKDLAGADAVVFVVEWTTQLQFGDRLDWVRLLSAVPRNRRVVIDCDGAYNDPISFRGDYNHKTPAPGSIFATASPTRSASRRRRRCGRTCARSCSTSTIRTGRRRSTSRPRISA